MLSRPGSHEHRLLAWWPSLAVSALGVEVTIPQTDSQTTLNRHHCCIWTTPSHSTPSSASASGNREIGFRLAATFRTRSACSSLISSQATPPCRAACEVRRQAARPTSLNQSIRYFPTLYINPCP
ncbi:hypothetical protein CGRA01v4_12883 [Colletotrichum graminicola]|nr:hypothetical protein CGRA01v4_12883 [Colletotrichum graminicola]